MEIEGDICDIVGFDAQAANTQISFQILSFLKIELYIFKGSSELVMLFGFKQHCLITSTQ